MEQLNERIEMALNAMKPAGPRDIRAYLRQPGPDLETSSSAEVDAMLEMLLSKDPNQQARLLFSNLIRSWDNIKDARWTGSTVRNTAERRGRIHEFLKSGPELAARIDKLLPFYRIEEPLIVSQSHKDWYAPCEGVRDYYWNEYIRYLREKRGWSEAAILNLDNSTRAIVECLANPESPEAYASRGLVMGYVQSGKTANFLGVAARAADAGYRLIIVLAGTWNILRNQTQRRFDKELLGKELLKNDETYDPPPKDWADFLEHGAEPGELGHYTWQRLTRPEIDISRFRAAIDSLEFGRANKAAPLHDPSNLHQLPVKLLIMKKHPGLLEGFGKDLELLSTRLADLPALIIDDESDQAGVNTEGSRPAAAGSMARSKTNERIVELLRKFPRAQYVGYTATPYANALIDADDPEDLFPKDFIISLERPADYMGISDFFDPDTDHEDLPKDDFTLPEIAYIRRVSNPVGADDEDLKSALRSYVLSGGVKLFRQDSDPARYKPRDFKHHTMLIHTSSLKGEQHSIAARVRALWEQCAFNSPRGTEELKSLWNGDFVKVCAGIGNELVPDEFEELVPYLSKAIRNIEAGQQPYLVLNSDSTDAPDFSRDSVWKMIIGGNKLSRGYTVEGLTVSYYRRVAGTGDTLMQMGRWFGFRPGYRDLVRVFLGVAEGRRNNVDLVALFKEVCWMEERFRGELKRYVRTPGARKITPREIPPLIEVCGNLPPTARNKMFNAMMATKNFGGQRSQQTLVPARPEAMENNVNVAASLLSASRRLGALDLGGIKGGKKIGMNAFGFDASTRNIIRFLTDYRWLEASYKPGDRPADTGLQIEFLEKQKHEIESWLILAPQRQVSFGAPLRLQGVEDSLKVKHRSRLQGRGFGVFGEPVHRVIAEYISNIEDGCKDLSSPNAEAVALRDPHRAVLLFYPVRETERGEVTIGYELVFPENHLTKAAGFTVRRKDERDQITVSMTG